ncbi:MAG: DNA-processing protein DprA, partial [Clostridia bacterium]|nr:DNA-processing protein DprA [Clostridia bacterium]
GTAVVEPAAKSGSMLTVNHAFRQGKEVFIIPGNLLDNDQAVLSELLSKGAKVVFSPSDFTAPFLDRYSDVIDTKKLDNNISAPVINPLDVPTKKTFLSKLLPDKKKEETVVRESETNHDINSLSAEEKAVYDFVADGAKATDEIIEATDMTLPQLSPILLRLQLIGVISKTTDNKYKLK